MRSRDWTESEVSSRFTGETAPPLHIIRYSAVIESCLVEFDTLIEYKNGGLNGLSHALALSLLVS